MPRRGSRPTPIVLIPAAIAESTPDCVSSNATHWSAGSPSSLAPSRNGSGAGLPFATRSPNTALAGKGSFAAAIRASATGRAHEVTRAHLSRGRAFRSSHAPGSDRTPSVSSASIRCRTASSASASRCGATSGRLSMLRRPWIRGSTSAGCRPLTSHHRVQHRSTASKEQISVPSRSNSTPEHWMRTAPT